MTAYRPTTPSSPLILGKALSSSEWLEMAYLFFEKCELKESKQAFLNALEVSRSIEKNPRSIAEAVAGLLRFSGEALDQKQVEYWEKELDQIMKKYPDLIPPMVWYCKGAIAGFKEEWKVAQRHYHRYLRMHRAQRRKQNTNAKAVDGEIAKGLVVLVKCLHQRGYSQRAYWLAHEVLKKIESFKYRGINGVLYLIIGNIFEKQKNLELALQWYQRAHAAFLEEHNWFHHLYVLYGYARLARLQQNYKQAHWYLELIEKAASDAEFGVLRREVSREKARLIESAVDLLIDADEGLIQIKGIGLISVKKQFILLEILKALTIAHERNDIEPTQDSQPVGLTKAEIIKIVWKQKYRPEAHDNKLYYNINRLRKLIEPDAKNPVFLQNWKEGYRFAPGIKVRWIDHQSKNK